MEQSSCNFLRLGTKDSKSFQFDLEAQLSMIIASLAGIVTPWLQVLLDSGHTKEDEKESHEENLEENPEAAHGCQHDPHVGEFHPRTAGLK